jgi:glycosyltransferase involved in cell wall biosynthesis
MVHHMWPGNHNPRTISLQRQLERRAHQAAVSQALARALPSCAKAVLPNPFDDRIFFVNGNMSRDRDILFVGRLIPQKGAHILIDAISRLEPKEHSISVTVAGEGPERAQLQTLITARGLNGCIQLHGQVTGAGLAELFNQHRIVVVPSIHPEAFGLVALEAVACGCVVMASNAGGLPEAIGLCGVTFPAGDAASLSETLQDLLCSPHEMNRFRATADQHLAKHRPGVVARRYTNMIRKSCGK